MLEALYSLHPNEIHFSGIRNQSSHSWALILAFAPRGRLKLPISIAVATENPIKIGVIFCPPPPRI
jgi:hypothetical protein